MNDLKISADAKTGQQYAAIPLRFCARGPEVLLITSRETRRWVIPKGWPEKNLTPRQVAELECYEEAGVRGTTQKGPIGQFEYLKRLPDGRDLPCVVDVYLLDVREELSTWPEAGQRERRWVTPGEAALLVEEGGLIALLLTLAGLEAPRCVETPKQKRAHG